MIAGSYDDIQGGICYGGIAHAGRPNFQRAMWFTDLSAVTSPIMTLGNVFEISLRIFISSVTINKVIFSHSTSLYLSINASRRLTFSVNGLNANESTPYQESIEADIKLIKDATSIKIYKNDILTANRNTTTIYNNSAHVIVGRNPAYGITGFTGVVRKVSIPSLPLSWIGDGISAINWADPLYPGTVSGTNDPAYIRGDGKVIVNGVIMNP